MASLLAKDAYLQSLARKICSRPSPEPRQRKPGGKTQGSDAAGPPKRKRKRAQKKPREQGEQAVESKARAQGEKPRAASQTRKPLAVKQERASGSPGVPAGRPAPEPDSLFALDVLRQRLHEKIQEARGQGGAQELSPAALEKRRRRRLERDRRKRKRRELRAQKKAAQAPGPAEAAAPAPEAPGPEVGQAALLFNKVEAAAEEEAAAAAGGPAQRRRRLRGPAPLTGRNYRQLLERLAARRARLAALRERDEAAARAQEDRARWASALHRAEGVRVRDDERLLRAALQRKERRRAQRRRRWERRAAHVVGTMQRRQELRRRHLRRRRAARAERRLDKARRKGRVLPQDLERAGLA
ncbi:surfeit locus protein 6 isoform X1 [Pipistrellus kuhlii]|uniref:Surfeit 6 n=1 Tax=Pipistrellus kuhlii TaxID=59472 RepID=A0A7J7RMB1_PIPKU|nr:surfeit locus protein 6 isoform X1 [Pipistrellus kuhlii]KAF6277243.1 surfeit 6 [Pipistrellus kuhlii]